MHTPFCSMHATAMCFASRTGAFLKYTPDVCRLRCFLCHFHHCNNNLIATMTLTSASDPQSFANTFAGAADPCVEASAITLGLAEDVAAAPTATNASASFAPVPLAAPIATNANTAFAPAPSATNQADAAATAIAAPTVAVAAAVKPAPDMAAPTATHADANYYSDSHRRAFCALAFDKKKGSNSGDMDRETYNEIIRVVRRWKSDSLGEKNGEFTDDELRANAKWKSENRKGYNWIKEFHDSTLELPDGTTRDVLYRLEKDKGEAEKTPKRIVLCKDDIFDVINDAHRSNGHMGIERTYTACCAKYYSVTQLMCRHYVKTCPTCMERNPKIPPQKGAKKPIYSDNYRDRFQVDLIDMKKFAKPNVYGVLQRWIMAVKDHSTGFTALFSLPRKKPIYVAFELERYFGMVGYPTIFHTDNGNEFTARLILDMIAGQCDFNLECD